MKILLVLVLLIAVGGGRAEAEPGLPSAGQAELPIWPGGSIRGGHPVADSERTSVVTDRLVAGRPWTRVTDVTRPTITLYPPSGPNTGAAVIVLPGGGFMSLAIDLEGTEVCRWLTSRGITCVLLKYRVPRSGQYWSRQCRCEVTPRVFTALQDAQRAVGLVRYHASEWHIDSDRIGVLGFSAGGYLVAALSTHFAKRAYAPVDAADAVSCRPDFAAAIYPGHLAAGEDGIELNPYIAAHIVTQTPPTFLVQSEDDDSDRIEDSLSYYVALKRAGIPVEMHLYAHGGHAFGVRRTRFPITAWPRLMETWLQTLGMVP
jgi:acetyl esterase/lipase